MRVLSVLVFSFFSILVFSVSVFGLLGFSVLSGFTGFTGRLLHGEESGVEAETRSSNSERVAVEAYCFEGRCKFGRLFSSRFFLLLEFLG